MRDRPNRNSPASAVPPVPSSRASPSPSPESSRRHFLFALGATGAGAAVANATVIAATATPDAAPVDDHGSRGYQETDHVRRYYASARI